MLSIVVSIGSTEQKKKNGFSIVPYFKLQPELIP